MCCTLWEADKSLLALLMMLLPVCQCRGPRQGISVALPVSVPAPDPLRGMAAYWKAKRSMMKGTSRMNTM